MDTREFLKLESMSHHGLTFIIIMIIVTPGEFFTSELADGLSLEFEW